MLPKLTGYQPSAVGSPVRVRTEPTGIIARTFACVEGLERRFKPSGDVTVTTPAPKTVPPPNEAANAATNAKRKTLLRNDRRSPERVPKEPVQYAAVRGDDAGRRPSVPLMLLSLPRVAFRPRAGKSTAYPSQLWLAAPAAANARRRQSWPFYVSGVS